MLKYRVLKINVLKILCRVYKQEKKRPLPQKIFRLKGFTLKGKSGYLKRDVGVGKRVKGTINGLYDFFSKILFRYLISL